MKDSLQRMQTQIKIISDLGYKLNPESVILDLGCGNGELVNEYLAEGYNCYGCDFAFKPGEYVETLFENDRIRYIDKTNYRLPFENCTFDCVFTDQVFEHVKDYESTLAEIKRVLKRGGVSLNFFPSKYQIIEPHVYVPFASINKKYNWLLFWAYLGIKKKSQRGLSAKTIARMNHTYLITNTYYLDKSEIERYCNKYFNLVRFSEDYFIKHMLRFNFLSKFYKVKFLSRIYSELRHRVLFLKK